MFQLSEKEYKNLVSQNVISSWGGTRKLPYAFSEQGVAMLSSVLNSETAIEVNIRIIRVFTKMREEDSRAKQRLAILPNKPRCTRFVSLGETTNPLMSRCLEVKVFTDFHADLYFLFDNCLIKL